MKIILIAAMDRNGAIGAGNTLPWHCPQDLRHFQQMTLGQVVLMGRKTADSLRKPLRDRVNLVLTTGSYQRDGFIGVASLDDARDAAMGLERDELWIIGGGTLYDQTIDIADTVHLTALNIEVPDADTWFPADRLVQYKASVVRTCTDPNVHFWTFSRQPILTVRAANACGAKTSME